MPDRRQIGEGRRRVLDYTVWDTSLVCGWAGVVVAPYQTELHGYVSLVLYVCVWGWWQVENSTICITCNCVTCGDACASDFLSIIVNFQSVPLSLYLSVELCQFL